MTWFPDLRSFYPAHAVSLGVALLTLMGPHTEGVAQNVPSNPAATGGTTNPAGTTPLERVVVTGVRLEDSILPTARPVESTYGLSLNVLDTPRSVTVISRTQLTDADVQTARDFSRLGADVYTPFTNGSPSSPYIRGQVADVFINGIRVGLTSEGVGIPLDFNSVETVDIVKGPAPALYGASQNVGGFINLNTKQPFFDKFRAEVSTTNGEYDQHRWTVDVGGPLINNTLAYRVSYSGEESGSYYRNVFLQSQALYTALTWTPGPNYRAELLNEFYETHYQLNRGINRPTQALIDDDLYVTGTQQFVNPTHQPISASNPVSNLVPSTVPASFGVVVPTGVRHISHSDVIVNPSDSSYAKTDFAQLLQTLNVTDGFQIQNTSHFYYLDRRQFGALRYSAIVEPSYVLENRTEFHLTNEFGDSGSGEAAGGGKRDVQKAVTPEPRSGGFSLLNELNTGFDFRHQHVYSATDIAHSYNNLFDLTLNPDLINVPLSVVTGGRNASLPVPGRSGYFGTPGGTYVSKSGRVINTGNGETNDTWSYDYGLFLQDRLTLNRQLSLFFGIRGDILHVDFIDPIHPSGFDPVKTNTAQGLINVNGSLTYKPLEFVTAYLTYNYSTSTSDGQGGGYSIGPDDRFDNPDFRRPSALYEGGLKFSLVKDKLFLSTAGFRQTRTYLKEDAPPLPAVIWGGEAELSYQPNRNFFATASYSYLDSVFRSQSPTQKTRDAYDAFLPRTGTGLGSPNSYTYPFGDYRQPGIPHHLFNVRLNYQLDCGLGVSFGVLLTSPIPLTYSENVKIPTQYQLDAGIFYVQKNWEVRLDFFNLTDQHNWASVSASNGQDLVYPELPFRVQGTVRLKF